MNIAIKLIDLIAFLIVGFLGIVVTLTGIVVASPGIGIRKIGEWMIRKAVGEGE